MNHIEQTELRDFLKGKLTVERMLAVDRHVSECAECKAALTEMNSSALVDFGAEVMGAVDCPEYEELSAYADGTLDAGRAASIRRHMSVCELCTRDLGRIRELRSHAALREKITVQPGMSRRVRRSPLLYWKQVLAGVSLAGAAALVIVFGNFSPAAHVAQQPIQEAKKPPIMRPIRPTTHVAAKPENSAPVKTPEKKPATSQVVNVATNSRPAPRVVPVLKDGALSVIRKGNTLALAAKNGSSARTGLEAEIAARIDQKLKSGKVTTPKPVQMAMASVDMRGTSGGYQAPPTAPKQIGPMGKVLLTAAPTFTWSAVDLAESYRIRIYNSTHNLVVDQIVKTNSFTPSHPLERGQAYSWRIGVRFGETDQWSESAAASFAVVSDKDYASIKRIQRTMPDSHLALGVAYESAGLRAEAANEYRALLKANPRSKLAHKLAGTVK